MVLLRYRREIRDYDVQTTTGAKKPKNFKTLPALNSLFRPEKRKVIIKKVFQEDETAFEKILDELDLISNWQEALQRLEDIFIEREIYVYDKVAMILSDIVYHRYYPDDQEIKL
ncbi:hypothetical protein L0128_22675 [candidate division KSB1 bacterium]|nr:hypothetical protein [candidate division KSB1 bacterium]